VPSCLHICTFCTNAERIGQKYRKLYTFVNIRIMKRFFGFTIFIALAAALALSVSAAVMTLSPNRNTIRGYDEVFGMMYEAIENGRESVDLSRLDMSEEDVVAIFGDVLMSSPEFFYIENSIRYYCRFTAAKTTVLQVNFQYKWKGDELARAKTRYKQELSYIVSMIDEGMSEAEKALAVHDYMIASYTYDESMGAFDAYSLLTKRKGVCQAYSLAYAAVLRALGMEAVVAVSHEMNHAWNMVKVDGKWYHVDLSHDDPAPDRPGRVLHENFLLCDESIGKTKEPHYGWQSTEKCDAGDYDGVFRGNITSAMVWSNGKWYYIDSDRNTLSVSDIQGSNTVDLYRFRDRWYVKGTTKTYWIGVFSGVSQFLGHIFVNTPYQVIIYSPRTGNINIFLEVDEGEHIYGSWVYKNTLEYMLSDSPSIDENTSTGIFEITTFSIEEAASPLPFTDVLRIDECYSAVKYVYERGLFKGVTAEKFAPDAALTRAMYVTVLGRLYGVDVSGYSHSEFTDVADGLWYTPYVVWASEIGLVNGVGDGRFNPTGEITREQVIKISAAFGRYINAGEQKTENTAIMYEDKDRISDWAYDSILYCAENGIIKNSGVLEPHKKATRAEAAGIIMKLAQLGRMK